MKISEEIAETLRDEIVAGIYKPRERLIEEELSDRFFVSRTPIREALKQLESAELVIIEPYKGPLLRTETRTRSGTSTSCGVCWRALPRSWRYPTSQQTS